MNEYSATRRNNNSILKWIVGLIIVSSVQVLAQSDTIQTNVPHLKDVYANDFYIGCLLSYRNIGLPTDPPVNGQSPVITPNGGYLIQYHMNSMSPGNNMKPQFTVDLTSSAAAYTAATTQAQKDSINIHPIVRFNGDLIAQLNWAQRQGFTFRGHTLVWHNQTPTAFFRTGYAANASYVSKDTMTLRMGFYIHEIVRLIHEGWPGLLSALDVVNEAIDDNTGKIRTSGNDWHTTFGDSSYVMKAFQFARQYTDEYGETQIKLYYNDYNTHLVIKANGIVSLLTPIFQAGYLDGIGMQEHDAVSYPSAADWIASYNKFYPICHEMAVTEFEVTTGSTNPSAAQYAAQANQYGQLLKCFVERSYKSGRGKIIGVSKDGLNDQYTQGSAQYSSLWDIHNQCKPAFYTVVDVGRNYNSLDSLIAYADSLQQSRYTAGSWSSLSSALSSAKSARDQNYSVTVSADTGLALAKVSLQTAVDDLVSTGVDYSGTTVRSYELKQNYPNPFNPSTTIEYQLPHDGHVLIDVYDLQGRRIRNLVDRAELNGQHNVVWDGRNINGQDVASGVYFYRYVVNGILRETKSAVLLK